jgi:acyl-CoA thioesterase-1
VNRFFSRIRAKAKDVSQRPILVVALGDSVTQGVMELSVLDAEGVFHRLLQKELEAFYPMTTFSTFNAGVSGGTVEQAQERLERDVLSLAPDLVLIAFGLNDCHNGPEGLAKFESDLREVVRRIQESTEADIVLVTPPFMARRANPRIHPDHNIHTDAIIKVQSEGRLGQYAQAIRDIGAARSLPVADVHREWERLATDGFDTDAWLINGLNHPNRQGHKLASQVVFHTILQQRPE